MPDQCRGSDFLGLDVTSARPRDRIEWLAGEVRHAVLNGQLAAGARVPPTRALAADLGLSRGTVVAAYQRLIDEGLLQAHVGAGTVVSAVTASRQKPRVHSGSASGPVAQPWRDSSPVRLDLRPGLPDLSLFPRTAWLRAERTILDSVPASVLGYPDPRGHPQLRSELASWLTRSRGVAADPEEVIVTAGVAQALAIIAEVLRRRGATAIAVEDPGSRGLHDHVHHWGLTPHPVPVDDEGIVVADLTDEPAVLVTPAHHFPTGVVLTPQRRTELLAWAASSGGLIIEDDYDAEHRYDRAPVRAIQALDPQRVAYVGSVSKSLAPGLRLGWIIAPRALHADLVVHKDGCDRGAPVLSQLVLAEIIRTGTLERHLRKVRLRQRRRRDALLDGLNTLPHPGVVRGVAAGLHLLVTLPAGVDDRELTARLENRTGIRVEPLSVHRLVPGEPGLVIGYAATPTGQLAQAGRDIASLLAGLSHDADADSPP